MSTTTSRKRVLVCNTGRCTARIKVTPELRPLITVSESGCHMLSAKDGGKCPRCKADSGFVNIAHAAFAHSLSSMFEM